MKKFEEPDDIEDEQFYKELAAVRRLDDLRMKGLDYSIEHGLKAAQDKFPEIADFLAQWQGKNAKDYIRHEVLGGLNWLQNQINK